MIETCRLKNVVIFVQTILNTLLYFLILILKKSIEVLKVLWVINLVMNVKYKIFCAVFYFFWVEIVEITFITQPVTVDIFLKADSRFPKTFSFFPSLKAFYKWWKMLFIAPFCSQDIKSFDCNWTGTQNHLVLKRTLNHLAKGLRTKWF